MSPDDPSRPILPGQALGVLGGGQLGRMFALAAKAMGYRVHVLASHEDDPAAQVADAVVVAAYDDVAACERFAQGVAAVTFEFENVASAMADAAERHARVRPDGRVLHTTQDRQREKSFLRDAGLPVTPFEAVESLDELREAATRLGLPGVLKTASWGYDGKGQDVVREAGELDAAWEQIGAQRAVLERMIHFERELSVVAVRGHDGATAFYGPIHNEHAHHILDVSICPAPGLDPAVADAAIDIAHGVVSSLEVVGVLCVELFLESDGTLRINELAPRPHNSGHLTIDAFACSQFEQQARALCGLPLGSTRPHRPAAMANLLGECWFDACGDRAEPAWNRALAAADNNANADASVHLHLYGKAEPRVGRKMGHLTALADTPDAAAELAVAARAALQPAPRTVA